MKVFVAPIAKSSFFAVFAKWNAFLKKRLTTSILIKIVSTLLATFFISMYLSVKEKTTNKAKYFDIVQEKFKIKLFNQYQ